MLPIGNILPENEFTPQAQKSPHAVEVGQHRGIAKPLEGFCHPHIPPLIRWWDIGKEKQKPNAPHTIPRTERLGYRKQR